MATNYHCILRYNITIEEDDNTLSSSSFSQTQRIHKNTQENNKKKELREGKGLSSNSCFALSFLAPASTLLFQTLSLGIFFF
jgi:hypothetical protein